MSNPTLKAKYWWWVFATTIAIVIGFFLGLFSSLPAINSSLSAISGFWGGALGGLCVGIAQKLVLRHQLSAKWILATTFGFSIGCGIGSLILVMTSNGIISSIFGLVSGIISLSFAQARTMKWQKNKTLKWLIANSIGVTVGAGIGVLACIIAGVIAGQIVRGGLETLGTILLAATVAGSLVMGLTYGGITGLFLIKLLPNLQTMGVDSENL
ncbi:MAG: hypothetical protein ACKO9I_16695 [Sphaerospermopsis kisseleviana]|uniref:Uncharacterized protein n=2 Tax=Sphaerospermopsis TaxID=752201 RepID=A0A480A4L8_9CYAN|nr:MULTISPECIES: hypothetical protein [Sphaerospermopsis]BAZ80980.1 hypothetical protein NIES73_22460 [Sphaerospermopsis kisseleviana NIES-73]MBD2134638.1 hypothetical protein [Sphaerospermopsis sp. FACHB-1094]MBD2144504.1 hypothetical protein [Sphaerospermopsis sp. FACHB-1194]MDB9444220.1 hypothetical protein [Sphaerospermopsis kisseleviana CS-549]GCL38776.1 hypothetical protein SR1949_38950 [Sphaerospermopsis reniformis]